MAQTSLTFTSHVSLQVIAGVQKKLVSMFTTSGSADVLGYEVSPANSLCGGTGKRTSRIISRTDGVFAPPYQRTVTNLFWRSATVGSLNP